MSKLDGLDITYQVNLFRQFLNKSWATFDQLMEEHDWENDGGFSDDWVQANWEFLVERELTENKKLISSLYMYNSRKRMTAVGSKYDYLVLVKPREKNKLLDLSEGIEIDFSQEVRLFGFCKALHPGFGLYPPFDLCDLCVDRTKAMYVVPFNDLTIYLKKVEN